MKLFAKKPCSFGGKKFYIGNEVPTEFVLDPKAQEALGVLAIVADEPAPEEIRKEVETMAVTVRTKDGDMTLDLTQNGLQAVVDVLTVKPSDAEGIIQQMEDGDALILLDIVDSRKAVKAAAEERAKALIPEESAGDQ